MPDAGNHCSPGKVEKVVRHRFGPSLLPVYTGIIVQVSQDEPQGGAGQRKGEKFIREKEGSFLSQTSEESKS